MNAYSALMPAFDNRVSSILHVQPRQAPAKASDLRVDEIPLRYSNQSTLQCRPQVFEMVILFEIYEENSKQIHCHYYEKVIKYIII